MDYPAALDYLNRHIGQGVHPGLDRIRALLDMMGHPEEAYPIIHIAGTNGKTSTARLASLLAAAHGLTTGTFISPHLQRVEERFALNGEAATPEQFVQAVADLAAFADLYEQREGVGLTYFELTAALALSWFANQAVDLAVVEVGLGGRLDATNVVRGDVAVVTGIGLEHTEFLGDTVAAIAGEKLGIVDPGAVLVTGPLPPEAEEVAGRVADERQASRLRYGEDFAVEDAQPAVGGWHLDIRGVYASYPDLFLPLHGRHQTINLAVAVAALEALFGRELDPEAVAEAVAVATSPGRMEPVDSGPLVMLDGAHNPDGFQALGAALAEEFPTIRWVLVLGAMADKDLAGMLPHLAPFLTQVICTSVASPRALSPRDLADRAAQLVEVPVEAVEEVPAAVERARRLAGEEGAVLVAGSLYLVGEARSHLLGQPGPHPNER